MAHDLTRWIEDADARRFNEAVLFDRNLSVDENHYVHLGHAVANVTSWLRHHVNRDSLASIGFQVFVGRNPH